MTALPGIGIEPWVAWLETCLRHLLRIRRARTPHRVRRSRGRVEPGTAELCQGGRIRRRQFWPGVHARRRDLRWLDGVSGSRRRRGRAPAKTRQAEDVRAILGYRYEKASLEFGYERTHHNGVFADITTGEAHFTS